MLSKIERYGPVTAAVLFFGIAWWNFGSWAEALSAKNGDIRDALGPVFDLATFSAGSLFAIYVLALSRPDGFLGRIFETETFALFHGYVARAIFLNVVLSAWTAAYMVVGFGNLSETLVLISAAAWAGTAVWAFLSVARVVVIFLMMVRIRSRRPAGKPAGQAS